MLTPTQRLRRQLKRQAQQLAHLRAAMPTPTPSNDDFDPRFDLYGGVAAAFNSRAPEQLVAGAAGTG